jgi:hypothetical protein
MISTWTRLYFLSVAWTCRGGSGPAPREKEACMHKMMGLLVVAAVLVGAGVASGETYALLVAADKELYDVGETAQFTVTVYKDGELLAGTNTLVEATFPDETQPVELTPVSPGVFSFEAVLTEPGNPAFTASVRHDFANAVGAMEAKIAALEAEIDDLSEQLILEPDPRKQAVLEAKILNRAVTVERFEAKIATFETPEVVEVVAITVVDPIPPVALTFMNCMNGLMATMEFPVGLTLGEVEQIVLPLLNVSPDAVGYKIGTSPFVTPLDESKTLEELGLTANGTMLYLWR